jgi:ABC-type nitrate/sulfonate/bicarbonate transport system substrate-binding protein
LLADATIRHLSDLKGKTIVCREGPARNAPIAESFREQAQLTVGEDLILQLSKSDQEAFDLLVNGKVSVALLPRPYGFWAEARAFKRIANWPDIVDDPLPISIETTARLLAEREKGFAAFLGAHREGIRYLKTHRDETIRLLGEKFSYAPSLAAKIWDQYLVCMDERLTVDFKQFERLLAQVAPAESEKARQLAAEWIIPGGLRD